MTDSTTSSPASVVIALVQAMGHESKAHNVKTALARIADAAVVLDLRTVEPIADHLIGRAIARLVGP